ncbi:hypothetical protein FV139_00260 [Parahaliea maris]|uniref:Uncharacterized protein n=1 Tax=Parahaliea maris TaxID=2716870 RepID=A0A5C9A7I0_9GAMM|nr:hypothetical protein [Parahaliea maris]TXS95982.1 hypothetical protein FV139_00260 [Parahaliea maris]
MKRINRKIAAAVAATALVPTLLAAPAMAKGRGNNDGLGIIYVESQGLYYETFATTVLPGVGRFQPLDPTGAPGGGPSTPYGPGDKDYVGGRWWVDTNNDGEMDAGDMYFSCPLLGPGRATP